MNKLIAITGGIGSGKSLALQTLKRAGYKVLSSDEIVKKLYTKHAVKKILKDVFPTAVSGEKHLTINIKKISEIAFNDKEKHKKLTSAITPLVMDKIKSTARRTKAPIFAEVPLLFECNYQSNFDGIMVIMRDKKSRIESVKARSKLSEEEIIARIEKQVDYEKMNLTDYKVIQNKKDIKHFEKKILQTAKELISK